MGTPLPFVPGVVKIVLNGSNSMNVWANVLHWTYTGGPPAYSDLLTFGSTVAASYDGNLMPLCPADTHIENVTLTDLSSMTGAGAEVIDGTVGTAAGAILPASACALVSYPSSIRYRGGHPRTYLFIGSDSDLLNTNEWKSASLATFKTAWDTFVEDIDGISSGGCTLQQQCAISYVNRYSNPVPPYHRAVPIIMPIPPTANTFEPLLASQRRRVRRTR